MILLGKVKKALKAAELPAVEEDSAIASRSLEVEVEVVDQSDVRLYGYIFIFHQANNTRVFTELLDTCCY